MYQTLIFININRTVLSQDKDLMSGKALGDELLGNSPPPGAPPHLPPSQEEAEMGLGTLLTVESPCDKEKHMGKARPPQALSPHLFNHGLTTHWQGKGERERGKKSLKLSFGISVRGEEPRQTFGIGHVLLPESSSRLRFEALIHLPVSHFPCTIISYTYSSFRHLNESSGVWKVLDLLVKILSPHISSYSPLRLSFTLQ